LTAGLLVPPSVEELPPPPEILVAVAVEGLAVEEVVVEPELPTLTFAVPPDAELVLLLLFVFCRFPNDSSLSNIDLGRSHGAS
jgi:hypothetical protein